MARIRHGRQSGFAAIPNATIDDAQHLDFMALGLLTVFLRQKDGWDINLERVGKKYGYGRDALANAMGLLQVARYVVKVRVQDAATAQWSTEIVTYDTPASEEEVTALLYAVTSEAGVMDARLIEATPAAKARSEARVIKLSRPRKNADKKVLVLSDWDSPDRPSPDCGKTRSREEPRRPKGRQDETAGQPEVREIRHSAQAAVSKKTVLEEDSPLSDCEPSGGASGEEEEISPTGRQGFASKTPRKGAVRPPKRLAVVPEPQEPEEAENGSQGRTEYVAMCRSCWQPFPRTPGTLARLCENCR